MKHTLTQLHTDKNQVALGSNTPPVQVNWRVDQLLTIPKGVPLDTELGSLGIVVPEDLSQLLVKYGAYIDMSGILQILSPYDGTTESVMTIKDEITATYRRKLKDNPADFSLFGDDVKKIVQEIDMAMAHVDRSAGAYYAYKTSTGIQRMVMGIRNFLWTLPEVGRVVATSRDFVLKAEPKIQQQIEGLTALEGQSQKEMTSLLHDYIVFRLLKILIERTLGELGNWALSADIEMRRLYLETELASVSQMIEAVPPIVEMNNTARKNIGVTKIQLRSQFDALITQLWLLIQTIQQINTITDAHNLSSLLGNMKMASLQGTFKAFQGHLAGLEASYAEQISQLGETRKLRADIERTIQDSDARVSGLRNQLTQAIRENPPIQESLPSKRITEWPLW